MFPNKRDQVVLITGASQGLGKALAKKLADQGAKVALVARDIKKLKTVEFEIRSQGNLAVAFEADISDKNAIYPLVAQITELLGPIDFLIHNASTLGPVPLKDLLDTDCEILEQTLSTNLVGPFRLTKAVLGSMLVRNTGCIIQISTDAAVAAYPTWGAYSVSKSAMDHMIRIWAEELSNSQIRFFSLDPGEMDTQMHSDAMPDADRTVLNQPDSVAQKIVMILNQMDSLKSGSRVVVSDWRPL